MTDISQHMIRLTDTEGDVVIEGTFEDVMEFLNEAVWQLIVESGNYGETLAIPYCVEDVECCSPEFRSDSRKTRANCSRCGGRLRAETDKQLKCEYPWYCPACDENMYDFEAVKGRRR